jgi:phage tail sheath gpL-like
MILFLALCILPVCAYAATPGTGTVAIGGEAQYVLDDGGNIIWDSGYVSIIVNGHTDTVTYSSGSPEYAFTIAQYLVNTINANNPYVTAACQTSNGVCNNSTAGSTIVLTARTSGSNTNYSLSATSVFDQNGTGLFTQPSFPATPSGSSLTGGTN